MRTLVDEIGSIGASPRADVRAEGDPVDLEAVLVSHPPKQLHVALAPVAEVEVLADHDQARPEARDEHLGHELLGRLVRPLLVEGDHDGPVDPDLLEQFELLFEVTEKLRCRLGTHHHRRMAVEGDHHGRQAVRGRPGLELGEESAMTEVNPVVSADGDRRTPCRWDAPR